MEIQNLIPQNKFDIGRANQLKNYSYEQINPIVPELLVWLQDCNWPVSRPVADYLVTISGSITSEIITILKGDDGIWKYWCLLIFAKHTKNINARLLDEIKRIAVNPSPDEIAEGVHEIAMEILEQKK